MYLLVERKKGLLIKIWKDMGKRVVEEKGEEDHYVWSCSEDRFFKGKIGV